MDDASSSFLSPVCVAEASWRSGAIPPCVFEVPPGYAVLGSKQRDALREEEEDLLQFAIQQSLLDAGSEHDQVGPGRDGSAGPLLFSWLN